MAASPSQVDAQEHQDFVLRTVQPALLGLADGSISTLAPLFAAAVATHESHVALLVGLSAALGAAITVAVIVVALELLAIAWVRWRWFPGTTVRSSVVQVTLAGLVVFAVGLAF